MKGRILDVLNFEVCRMDGGLRYSNSKTRPRQLKKPLDGNVNFTISRLRKILGEVLIMCVGDFRGRRHPFGDNRKQRQRLIISRTTTKKERQKYERTLTSL